MMQTHQVFHIQLEGIDEVDDETLEQVELTLQQGYELLDKGIIDELTHQLDQIMALDDEEEIQQLGLMEQEAMEVIDEPE